MPTARVGVHRARDSRSALTQDNAEIFLVNHVLVEVRVGTVRESR